MTRVTHRSVVPIYFVGGVWLIAGLFLPMYRLWHFILYAVLSALAYFLGTKLFPPVVEEIEAPEAAPDSGDAEVDALIAEARAKQKELKLQGSAVRDEEVSASAGRLYELTDKILSALEEEPSRARQLRRFLSYFLPTSVSLLDRFRELERQNVEGPNITSAMDGIRRLLGQCEEAFKRQLDSLYESEAMDISAEISVMQQLMKAENLTDSGSL